MSDKARKKAEEHWVWLETVLHKIFVDAFIHGYKHGKENTKPHNQRNNLATTSKE